MPLIFHSLLAALVMYIIILTETQLSRKKRCEQSLRPIPAGFTTPFTPNVVFTIQSVFKAKEKRLLHEQLRD